MSRAQKTLERIYREKIDFEKLQEKIENEGLSHPLLVDLDAFDYLKSKYRLMIVGQQTRMWGQPGPEKGEDRVKYLIDNYRHFYLGIYLQSTPFWRFATRLCEKLEGAGKERRFLWSNIFKCSQNKKEPDAKTAEFLLRELNLLPIEIEKAKPRAVVFFTGPSNDRYIEEVLPGVKFKKVREFEKKMIMRVEHDLLPAASFRTYHPGYLQRIKRQDVIDKIVTMIKRK